MKRSFSDSDLLSSNKKAKNLSLGTESKIVKDWLSSSTKKDKHWDAEDRGPESLIVNPASMRDKHQDDEDRSVSRPLYVEPGFKLFPDRPKPDPKFYLDEAWGLIKPAIKAIFLVEEECFCYPEILNAVRKSWWAKSGEDLFKMIEEECETYISAAIQSVELQCNNGSSDLLFPLMEKVWLEFHRKLKYLCSIAGSEGQRVGGRTLWSLCLKVFPNRLYLASEVRDKILARILVLIKDHRSGKSVDMDQLSNVMSMFCGASFYDSGFFEKPILGCAAEFYSAEAKQVLAQCDLPQYLKHVERRLHEEKEICGSLAFFMNYREPLFEILKEEFLRAHAFTILEKGFAKLMGEGCGDDLRRMYDLFSEANLVGHLNVALGSYILKTGREMVVKGLSLENFKASIDKIWFGYFLEDVLLQKTIEQCFFKDLGLPWKDLFASEYI